MPLIYKQEDSCPMGEIQLRPQWGFRPGMVDRSSCIRSVVEKLRDLRVVSREEAGKLNEPVQEEDQCPTWTSSDRDSTSTVLTDRSCGSSSSPVVTMDPLPRVSWMRIKKGCFLGEGAYGSTYKGILSLKDGRKTRTIDVAIKIMHEGDGELMHEACLLQAMAGAGGVPHLFGVTEEAPEAIVMEFCPGQVLRSFLQTQPLLTCVKASLATFKALEQFHEAGYVHRDLHEDNIIVDVDSNQEISARIIDVGLAVLQSEDDDEFSEIRTEGDILDLYDIAQGLEQLLDDEEDHEIYDEFKQTLDRIRADFLPEETE